MYYSTHNPHLIYICLRYHHLSPTHFVCIITIYVSIPKTTSETRFNPDWQQDIIGEMFALHSSGAWEIVPLPPGKSIIGCRWVYAAKVGPDGQIDRLKAQLVLKGYT